MNEKTLTNNTIYHYNNQWLTVYYLHKITFFEVSMKKIILVFLVSLVCFSSFSQNNEKSFYVKATGNDDNLGRSEDSPFKTLHKALEAVSQSSINKITIIGTLTNESENLKENSVFFIRYPAEKDIFIVGKNNAVLSGIDPKKNGKSILFVATYNNFCISFENIEFSGLTDEQYGANAIYLGNGKLHLKNCKIINNYSILKGTGLNISSGHCSLDGVEFKNNKSEENGGAIFCSSNLSGKSSLLINNCAFSNNLSEKSGGAIFSNYVGDVSITNTSFVNNSSKENGGALYTCGDSLCIENSVFENNSAIFGGAIFAPQVGIFKFNSCNFIKNKANQGGGIKLSTILGGGRETVIYDNMDYCNTNNDRFIMNNIIFEKNVAKFLGGAVYIDKNDSYFDSTLCYIPKDEDFNTCKFNSNQAGDEEGNDIFNALK